MKFHRTQKTNKMNNIRMLSHQIDLLFNQRSGKETIDLFLTIRINFQFSVFNFQLDGIDKSGPSNRRLGKNQKPNAYIINNTKSWTEDQMSQVDWNVLEVYMNAHRHSLNFSLNPRFRWKLKYLIIMNEGYEHSIENCRLCIYFEMCSLQMRIANGYFRYDE